MPCLRTNIVAQHEPAKQLPISQPDFRDAGLAGCPKPGLAPNRFVNPLAAAQKANAAVTASTQPLTGERLELLEFERFHFKLFPMADDRARERMVRESFQGVSQLCHLRF